MSAARTRYVLIEAPDGSRQACVIERGERTLDGYDDWTVIARPRRLPRAFESWDRQRGRWLRDEAAHARHVDAARARDPKAMAARMTELEARVAALEALLAKATLPPEHNQGD